MFVEYYFEYYQVLVGPCSTGRDLLSTLGDEYYYINQIFTLLAYYLRKGVPNDKLVQKYNTEYLQNSIMSHFVNQVVEDLHFTVGLSK